MNASVRLYGRALGHGSHAQVTAGFASALRDAEMLAGLVAFDRDLPPDSPQPGGAMAPRAVFTGPLGYLPAMRRGARHVERYAMLAPNSSFVPGNLLLLLEQTCTEILVPSRWARDVVEEQTSLPVRVVPHGVASSFAIDRVARAAARRAYDKGAFSVLHLSSSLYERKGTLELLTAWAMLHANGDLPPTAQLRLILEVDALARMRAWVAESGLVLPNLSMTARLDASPGALAALYSAQHVICQPSRGEGFGLCPLEALACGVPVVATTCTGHSEWAARLAGGCVPVEHGSLAPIDDGPGALAPLVSPDAVASALRKAYSCWCQAADDAEADADDVRAQWQWSVQLAPLLESFRGPVCAGLGATSTGTTTGDDEP